MVYSFVTPPGTGASPLWVTSLLPGFIFQFDLKNKLKKIFFDQCFHRQSCSKHFDFKQIVLFLVIKKEWENAPLPCMIKLFL